MGWVSPRAILLVLLLCAPAAWAEGEPVAVVYAQSTATKRVKKAPALRVVQRLPKDIQAAAQPGVRLARLGKTSVLFVDVNGDGRFDDRLVDGWTPAVMPAKARTHYVFPLGDALVLGADVVRYRVAADAVRVDFTLVRAKASREVRAGLVRLNVLRVRNALPPLSLHAVRSAACAKHVAYMKIHASYAHEEVEGRRGWSKDGAYAGIHSVIDLQVTLAEAFDRWFATLHHRWPLTDPRLTAVGAAVGDPYAMCSPLVDKRDERWGWPVLVPASDSEDQPTRAGRELPNPYPVGEAAGYPITLQFPTWRSAVGGVRAIVRKRGPAGAEVACRVSWPGTPANPERERNDGVICLIPRRPLAARTVYWVQVDYTWREVAERRTWTFCTGVDRGPPAGGTR